MASVCSAIFNINVGMTADCTVTLDIPTDITVSGNSLAGGFIKDFSYTIGTAPAPDNSNYGFRLAFSGGAEDAVGSRFVFLPSTPRIETPNEPNKVQSGRLLVYSIDVDTDHPAVADMAEVSVNLTIFVNTGFP